MRIGRQMLVLAGGCALAACQTVMPERGAHPLAGTSWHLAEIREAGADPVRLDPRARQTHTIEFREDGRLAMQLGCNRGNASWSASRSAGGNGTLVVGRVATTRMACPGPDHAGALAAELPQARQFAISANGKGLRVLARSTIFEFVAAEAPR